MDGLGLEGVIAQLGGIFGFFATCLIIIYKSCKDNKAHNEKIEKLTKCMEKMNESQAAQKMEIVKIDYSIEKLTEMVDLNNKRLILVENKK